MKLLDIFGFIFIGFIFFMFGLVTGSEIISGASIIFGGLLAIFVKLDEIKQLLEQDRY